jgi:pentatricopeptide repeat protein
MKRSGSQALRPDKYTFTSLIKSVSNQDDIQELLYDMRERGVEPDCVTYNTMIKALCETKRWTQATRLVTEMESRGVAPDSMTYGYLMNAMLKTGKPNACLALFESACASPRTSALTENIYLYTTAITAASMLGDYERALELVSRMTALGIRPNMKTLTAVMGACLSSGRPDLASQLFQRMDNPDGYAMAQGIQALCASGRLDSAMELLRQQQRGVRAVMTGKDLMRSYHAVLKAALDGSDFDMARSAVADLFSKGYIPSRSIVLTVTDMMKIGSASSEESVNDEEALQQQQFSFGLFLIDRTVARNLPVDSRLYTSVLAFAARQGGLYRKVANLMMESKASVGGSGATSKLLLSVAVTDKDDDSAGTILDESWSATTGATIPSTWDDLFLNYDSYKKSLRDEESSSQRLLPSLPVRVTSRDVPRVLRAEQVVSSRNKKASSSSSSSSSSSAEPRNLSSQSRLAVS